MTDDEMFAFGQLENDLQRSTDDPIRCVVHTPTANGTNERWYVIYPVHLDFQ